METQRKDKERVSVFLDGDFWTGMSQSLLVELRLSQGDELSSQRKEEIEALVVDDKAYTYALKRLSYKAYSEKQLRDKLELKEYEENTINATIRKLKKLSLIDDQEYALSLIRSKKNKGYGKSKLLSYLKDAGIDPDMISTLLTSSEDEENARAKQLLDKKFRGQKLDTKAREKAISFLIRRGFSFSIAQKLIQKIAMSETAEMEKNNVAKALPLLERRYRSKDFDSYKARNWLYTKGFKQEVITQAIEEFTESRFLQDD